VIITRQFTRLSLAALLAGLSLAATARSQPEQATADIRRTSFGVPHIRADNERGLGYGIGYAYAQDNLCLLANEVVTVNGERSRYFGPEQSTVEERENQVSDVFFNWLNTPQAVDAFWQAQTAEVRDLMQGYVAGYNRSLTERRAQGLPQQCQGDWVREINVQDLVRLTRRLLVEGGVGQPRRWPAPCPPRPPRATQGTPRPFRSPINAFSALPSIAAATPSPWAANVRSTGAACCWPTRISRGSAACVSIRCT
jgi:acyl-homoserine-lactone acylase